jgi:hypothetical protein
MKTKYFILLLLFAKATLGAFPAGEVLWPVGRGPGAALINPAVLGNPAPTDFALKIPGWNLLATNNSFSVGFWNSHIAEDSYWDDGEIRQILDRIPSSGLEGIFHLGFPILGLRYRQWAFNADALGTARVNAPKSVAELALLGTRLDENYSFHDLIGGSFSVIRYSLGFGHPIEQNYVEDLNAGITVHYYQGLVMADVGGSYGNLYLTDELIQGSGEFRTYHGFNGHGIGVDIGASCAPAQHWQVGLVCRQIGATIDWDLEETNIESFEAELEGIELDSLEEEDYLDRVLSQKSTTIEGGRRTLRLPVTLQATAMYDLNAQWTFTGEIGVVTKESLMGKDGAEVGTGAIFHAARWAILHTGVILGGAHKSLFMFGSGLRFSGYELDLEFYSRGLFNSSHGIGMSLSQRIFF